MMKSLTLLDGDCPMNSNFLIKICKHISNLPISVGGNGSNIRNGISSLYFGRLLPKLLRNKINSSVNSLLDVGRIEAGLNLLESFFINSSG
jgi:hypothetical protein